MSNPNLSVHWLNPTIVHLGEQYIVPISKQRSEILFVPIFCVITQYLNIVAEIW